MEVSARTEDGDLDKPSLPLKLLLLFEYNEDGEMTQVEMMVFQRDERAAKARSIWEDSRYVLLLDMRKNKVLELFLGFGRFQLLVRKG
ncbi:hypothetical protein Droror1_Dr00026722 [Drosera rotundifolia]